MNISQILAHTISQHIRELYGLTYLPIFILTNVLPFVGLGLLSGDKRSTENKYSLAVIFFVSIGFGLIISLFESDLHLFLILNSFWIFLIGLLLLLHLKIPPKLFIVIILVSGIFLGYEHSIRIINGKEYRWLFAMLFVMGNIVFLFLLRKNYLGKNHGDLIRTMASAVFLIAGIIVLLLT